MAPALQEVQALLGAPDNYDTTNIWIWLYSLESVSNRMKWADASFDDGIFLVFLDERLVSPILKTTETTPWEYYKHLTGANDTQAEAVLGNRPKVITIPQQF